MEKMLPRDTGSIAIHVGLERYHAARRVMLSSGLVIGLE